MSALTETSATPPAMGTPPRALCLAVVALALIAAMVYRGPWPQWPGYHAFADSRSWLGIPNAADVLSNLPFLAIGLWGWWGLRGARGVSTSAWRVFAAAMALTAVGSAYYHWTPSNDSLVFDRLPIAWACAALSCAFLGERAAARWGKRSVLAAAVLFGGATVIAWWLGERSGQGDLRAYLCVQFLPLLLVPMGLTLRLPLQGPGANSAVAWASALALYVAAKLAEGADHQVLHASAVISGHTIKHLLAAGAALVLLRGAVNAARASLATTDQLR